MLLDELDYPGAGLPDPRTAHVIVELKTANAIPLLRYCCGPRIMALPTAQLNARRFVTLTSCAAPCLLVAACLCKGKLTNAAKLLQLRIAANPVLGQRCQEVLPRWHRP